MARVSYLEVMKSQLVVEVSKNITDIVVSNIKEELSKMEYTCEQKAIRTVEFSAALVAKEKEERKLDINEAISQNRIGNLIHRRDENELRNTIFVKGATSKVEAIEAVKVITENSEDVAISTEMVRKGGRNRFHISNEPDGAIPANENTESSSDPNQQGAENEGTNRTNPNEINQFHGARMKLDQATFEFVMKNKSKLNDNPEFKDLFIDKAQTREGLIKRKLREEIRNTLPNANEDGNFTFNGKNFNKHNGKLPINKNYKIVFINNRTE